jgi:hypothetical protein
MDEVLLTKLDAIKDSINEMNIKLARIEAWQQSSEDRHARQQAEIDALKAEVKSIRELHTQAIGAVRFARGLWLATSAVGAVLTWFVAQYFALTSGKGRGP